MFERFFKPKWKSTNPDKRKIAVADLNPFDEKQGAILTDLALMDPDNEVRIAAIEKLSSILTLSSLLLGKESDVVLAAIVKRLVALFGQKDADKAQIITALETSQNKVLAQALLDASVDVEVKQLALKYLNDEAILTKLACEHPHASVRQAAAEQVHGMEALETILKVAKNKDKNIYRIVKERVAVHRAEQAKINEEKAKREEIVKHLETHGRISFDAIYVAKFEHLLQQWEQLKAGADNDLFDRVEKARAACNNVVAEHEAEIAARKLAASEKERAEIECHEAIAQLERTLESLHAEASWESNGLPALNALIKTQASRWDEANRLFPANKALLQRFERVHLALNQFATAASEWANNDAAAQEALTVFREDHDVLTPLVEKAAHTLSNLVKRVRWPEQFAKPASLPEIEKALHDFSVLKQAATEKNKAKLNAAKAAIEQLKAALAQGTLKAANKALNEAQYLLRELPLNMSEKIMLQLRELTVQVNELRDWQGFATTPKKEQLCDSMEKLIDAEMDPANKADAIKALQEEWRALGVSGPQAEQSLWERFKAASDKAWEPCSVYYAEQAEIRAKNLAERERVISELKLYLDQTDWANADWKLAQQVYEVARHDWQRFTYVDRKPGQETQKQFDILIESLKQKIDAEREKNFKLKQDLVKRAEALLTDADAQAAINRVKEFQVQWKEIGHAGHKADRELWKAFRTACDGVFEKRNLQRDAKREQDQSQYQHAKELIAALEKLADDSSANAVLLEKELERIDQEYDAIELNDKQRHSLKNAYQNAMRNLRRVIQLANSRVHEARWQHAEVKAQVCEQLENALINGQDISDLDVSIAQGKFQNAGEIPKIAEVGLAARFAKVSTVAETKELAALGDAAANTELLHQLTLGVEILMDIASPEEDREKRMQYSVARLQAGQRETRAKSPQLAEELWSEWLAVGVADSKKRTELYQRFLAAIKPLLG